MIKSQKINIGSIFKKSIVFLLVMLSLLRYCFAIDIQMLLYVSEVLLVLYFVINKLSKHAIHFHFMQLVIIALCVHFWVTKVESYDTINAQLILFSMIMVLVFFYDSESVNAAVLAVCIFTLFNLILNYAHLFIPSLYKTVASMLGAYTPNSEGRLLGLGWNTGRNAFYCIAGSSLFLCRFLTMYSGKKRFYDLILALLFMVIVLLTGKRGHVLFSIGTTLFVYQLQGRKISDKITRLVYSLIFISLLLGIGVEFIPGGSRIIEKTSQGMLEGDISTGRIILWAKALELFVENPVWGIGYGSFHANYFPLIAAVHNDYLQWLCEGGIVGFSLNVLFLIYTLRLSIMNFLRIRDHVHEYTKKALYLSLWSVFMQFFVMIYSFTGLPHFDVEIQMVYSVACIIGYSYDTSHGVIIRF